MVKFHFFGVFDFDAKKLTIYKMIIWMLLKLKFKHFNA